jgi:hypothetical protein
MFRADVYNKRPVTLIPSVFVVGIRTTLPLHLFVRLALSENSLEFRRRLDILTVSTFVFWDLIGNSLLDEHQYFSAAYCLPLLT